ncbi:hypothetical protein DFJ73DRAFT_921272 [Zopfochytrium polystomum]|nr:hypothetical protein DFJ73DRAFT_921272 [Zopfochytrium polystomum]
MSSCLPAAHDGGNPLSDSRSPSYGADNGNSAVSSSSSSYVSYVSHSSSAVGGGHIYSDEDDVPAAVVPLSETELSGAFSGAAAWEHLQTIAAEPHMYSSDANLRVRAFLIEKLQEFDRLAASRSRPGFLDIAKENVNVTAATGKFFFESNNVIVRINGANAANATAAAAAPKDRHALLVSAHYDSTPVSYGMTDDASPSPSYSSFTTSFNFNNGEEMFLPGFVYHPWFTGIKAFINLEGTGSAPGTRSMLFLTNSPALVKAWKQPATFHNLRGFVTAVCRDDPQLLPSLAASPEQGLAKPMDDPLPAPNFVFYDLFGQVTLTPAYALVILSCAAALLAVLVLSWWKAKLKPGSTYSLPAATWPGLLPLSLPRSPRCGCASPPRGWRRCGGFPPTTAAAQCSPRRPAGCTAAAAAGGATPHARRCYVAFARGRLPAESRPHPVQKWLAYGLLGFWTTLLTAGLYFAARWNWHGFYFVSDWAFFAVLSVAALAPMVLKWWKAEAVVVEEPTTVGSGGVLKAGGRRGRRGVGSGGVSVWKRKVVKFFKAADFSTILPTAISDGAAEYNIDLIFGALFVLLFVNLLPPLQLAIRSTSACCEISFPVPTPLTDSALKLPPCTLRHHPYVFTKTWNITDSPDNSGTPSYPNTTQLTLSPLTTMSAARFQSHMARAPASFSLDCAIPPAPPVAPWSNPVAPHPACTATVPVVPFGGWGYTYDNPSKEPLVELTLGAPREVPGTGRVVEVEGTLVGTPGSRICTLQPSFAAAAAGAGVADPSLALWVLDADESGDPRDATAWRPETYEYGYDDAPVVIFAQPGTVSPPSSASPAAGLPRIRVPFLRLSGLEYVEAACYHSEVEDVGGLWGTLQAQQGGWMKPTHGKFGGVVVVRRVKVDVAA